METDAEKDPHYPKPLELPKELDEESDSRNRQKPFKTYKELFEEFYSGTTLHGFRFLFKGGNIRRIIWFLICSAVFAFSVFLFESLLRDYLDHKVHTTISRNHATHNQNFPTIMICPLQKSISSYKMGEYPIDIEKSEFMALRDHLLRGVEGSNKTKHFVHELIEHGIDTKSKFINSYDLPIEAVLKTEVLDFLTTDGSCTFYGEKCNGTWFTRRTSLQEGKSFGIDNP